MAKPMATFSLLLVMKLCAGTVYCANTHHDHTATEHVEQDSIKFYYEPDFHYVVAVTKTTCFMAPLTRDERDHVHSSQGLQEIELRMMRQWIGQLAETKIYHDDISIPQNIQHWCQHQDIFLLARNITAETTHSSPLG